MVRLPAVPRSLPLLELVRDHRSLGHVHHELAGLGSERVREPRRGGSKVFENFNRIRRVVTADEAHVEQERVGGGALVVGDGDLLVGLDVLEGDEDDAPGVLVQFLVLECGDGGVLIFRFGFLLQFLGGGAVLGEYLLNTAVSLL